MTELDKAGPTAVVEWVEIGAPVRKITWFQFSSSDIRSIGVAQAASTIFAALGTFAMSTYWDLSKDLALAEANNDAIPDALLTISNITLGGGLVFWFLSIAAFLWQGSELSRIKAEHGHDGWYQRLRRGNGTR